MIYVFKLLSGTSVVVEGHHIVNDEFGCNILNCDNEIVCHIPACNIEYWYRQDASISRR